MRVSAPIINNEKFNSLNFEEKIPCQYSNGSQNVICTITNIFHNKVQLITKISHYKNNAK